MTRQSTIERLKQMQLELQRSGVAALYLFGSCARGEMQADSDIDIAFEVEPKRKFSLLDQASLQLRLENELGRKVDFLERHALHPDLKPRIERDLVKVF